MQNRVSAATSGAEMSELSELGVQGSSVGQAVASHLSWHPVAILSSLILFGSVRSSRSHFVCLSDIKF